MIFYWFHLVFIFFSSKWFRSKIEINEDIKRKRRVSIFDCEGLRYMSNTRYCFYMDFIRYELLFRSNLYSATTKKGMYGVLGSQKLIYKRPLKLWSKYCITLKLEGWDDKWVYHRQEFTQQGEVCAIGFTKLAFLRKGKIQNMSQIVESAGYKGAPKWVNPDVLILFASDRDLLTSGVVELG